MPMNINELRKQKPHLSPTVKKAKPPARKTIDELREEKGYDQKQRAHDPKHGTDIAKEKARRQAGQTKRQPPVEGKKDAAIRKAQEAADAAAEAAPKVKKSAPKKAPAPEKD